MTHQLLFARLACFFSLLLLPALAYATHNRAGEIRVEQVGGCNSLTLKATIITWTKTSSQNADRDTLDIDWGDGNKESVLRSNGNGNGVDLPNDIKYNEYVAYHTYAGPATYRISMTDPNRIAGIVNVNPPSSENVQFHIETIYSFQDPQFGGCNSTPALLQPPIDVACLGKPFKHNPNAFDPDGDSLSYKLIIPLQDLDSRVPNYSFPSQINPGPDNIFQLDPVSGDLLWATPQMAGEYNVAMIIISWRNGAPIDTTIRDMQILVENCDNNPPDVTTIQEICVVAGDTVAFKVFADDPDSSDLVQLTALGGPLQLPNSPAVFSAPSGWNAPLVEGNFWWPTTCEHISNQNYSVVFKAVDTISPSVPQLTDLQTVKIKVVGPPPLGVEAQPYPGFADIFWEKPYACDAAAGNYFYGFSVWRREGSNPFTPDTCETGLVGRGYTQLVFRTKQMQNGRYWFRDTTVERGRTYCYRVLAKFARTSTGGYPYNLVESLPSEEVCIQLPRDLPLITNVSVRKTEIANGEIEIRWSRPLARDLDTTVNTGPYRYQVRRASGFSTTGLQDIPGASLSSQFFATGPDTFFVDKNLDTENQPYSYEIAYFTRGSDVALGTTNVAASIFLNVASTDNINKLSWQEAVPWGNYRYGIFRENDQGQFDSIGFSTQRNFADTGLVNGRTYCYFVKSFGTYSIGGVVNPIVNLSQIDCGAPLDTLPPCTPELAVNNLCTNGESEQPDPPFENSLTWSNPNLTCARTDDVIRYKIYFAPNDATPLSLLETIEGAENTTFTHILPDALAGCYAVTAIDTNGNEGLKSNLTCVDNCPQYELPNAFTPDGDGHNDFFRPFPGWRFVESVDMQVFNRWGNLVWETRDPALDWSGANSAGRDLAAGTYFYVCRVYERRVGGVVQRPDVLSGYIELLRGR